MVKKEWLEKGFVSEPIDASLNLQTEIRKLCKEKNAVIMAHYYTEGVIQDVADFVGDSLALAQKAAKTNADIIVMCGVHFMGETNKILCPNTKLLLNRCKNINPELRVNCAYGCPFVTVRLVLDCTVVNTVLLANDMIAPSRELLFNIYIHILANTVSTGT